MACDVRIASRAARIGFVEAARGLCQTNGVTWLLPRIVGSARALELIMTAQLLSADDAERIGLVNRVAEADDFTQAVRAFTATVTANAPLSVSEAIRLVRTSYDHGIDRAMDLEVAATARCLASEDVREGTRAFHEGRNPTYQGT
jgi:enoyl-CoA hydratase/carnithine racemase